MPILRPRKFTFFPFLILFKRIESIDMTPCVISFLVYFVAPQFLNENDKIETAFRHPFVGCHAWSSVLDRQGRG